jgi:hypothetical protein
MRIVNFETLGVPGIAADEGSGWHGLTQPNSEFPGTLPELAGGKFSFSLTGSFVVTTKGELHIRRHCGGQGELKSCAAPGGASSPQVPPMRLND